MPVLNIGSKSDDWRACRLSNFSADAFVLDGERMASVEGFIQGTKFPDGHPTRQQIFQSVGVEAKRFGKKAERKFVWWNGRAISYGSPEHHELIERAIRAKFEQNTTAMDALLATRGMILTHDLGHPDPPNTSLPAKVFCDILTRIREETLRARK
ncbi:MAG: hypothetical protein A3I26_01635 [Candidatus Yanofskybacteria bacterium RIFCSPLOWO2_02_FULL_43_10]|uniref:Uncharacterized protein n=1 Tax=Candidatus Yanofskybacteria bacterium RIFCSPLOWO2_12_FULL_43_11b TaxID=1802710 RepID=A0A1F8H985_9BACT|nr:MAG: hypothetical protein A2742_00965 [Candidatus Yanofskybacteria bacterium RIFCSPHIGHO2_01_FULL_43_32]OGN11918.1 MAG: hypothetical protein A3C69_02510 [Candidatus Yanofskybacteria bacterium RIFCSPHIGHO2_02_FULL_43_12]OGN24327.1 MAG: hypothetical protein A2923_00205 [Candidatus Yanofskybacteria bacterium RIFCSPLOWO2_01_FULL_43_46]OGN29461.1 MAG: hypothetical protein A3I26_01635 [Candidatus Yanofskybacteria bacterium RIFCSPLOWO2_02_FULL_43_10]OGN33628.1 MAG: hypothetical protein A3G51_01180 